MEFVGAACILAGASGTPGAYWGRTRPGVAAMLEPIGALTIAAFARCAFAGTFKAVVGGDSCDRPETTDATLDVGGSEEACCCFIIA